MKKLLLIAIGAICSVSAFSQYAEKPLISVNTNNLKLSTDVNKTPSKIERKTSKTRAASRWYDIVEAVNVSQGSTNAIYSNDNYNLMWTDSTMLAPFSDGVNTIYDGIWVKSLQQVMDPSDPIFNSADYNGLANIQKSSGYTIDSVQIAGVYSRNPNKPNVVDTLIVSIAHGPGGTSSNVKFYYFASPTTITNYGDTVRFGTADLNINTYIANGSGVWSKKIPLTTATEIDTLSNGFNLFSLAPNVVVPAGELSAMTVTFKSGDTWTPFLDTVRVSGATTPNFNNFRFVSFEENAASFQEYRKGYYNASSLMQQDTSGWGGEYPPSYAYTSASYSYEHHWWFWKLSCPTCWSVNTEDFTNINDVNVYPNPVSDEVKFSFSVKDFSKTANISISNSLGQIVKQLSLSNVAANTNQHASINVSDLSSGIYIYTIEANGQKVSNKLMIK
ncbi:MAG: T9SS type A sorting domain-containing protein [Chitinophagaceae bacterium]